MTKTNLLILAVGMMAMSGCVGKQVNHEKHEYDKAYREGVYQAGASIALFGRMNDCPGSVDRAKSMSDKDVAEALKDDKYSGKAYVPCDAEIQGVRDGLVWVLSEYCKEPSTFYHRMKDHPEVPQ